MKRFFGWLTGVLVLAGSSAALHGQTTATVETLPLSGDYYGVHDPVIARDGSTYYTFSTGGGLQLRTSGDLRRWDYRGDVLGGVPAWAQQDVPGVQDLWAPDISYFNGRYHLYYSASTFGSNHSAIGLATSPTLDPTRPDFGWTDQGKVLDSRRGDNYNAIDPNIVIDSAGDPWLSFGSFWDGIRLTRLSPTTGKPFDENNLTPLARRSGNTTAIEAPYIVEKDGFYYQFVAWDLCCRGADSTYNIRVGRSTSIDGVYLDRAGIPMTQGGGTLILEGEGRWAGPGHPAVFSEGSTDWLVYHSYDTNFSSAPPALRLSRLGWDDQGWPSIVAIPEPTATALAATGALVLLRRRRR